MILDVDGAGPHHAGALAHQLGAAFERDVMQDVAEGDAIEGTVGERQSHSVVDARLDIECLEEAVLNIHRCDIGDAEQILHRLRDDAGPPADIQQTGMRGIPQRAQRLQQGGVIGGYAHPVDRQMARDQRLDTGQRRLRRSDRGRRNGLGCHGCLDDRSWGFTGALRTRAERLATKFQAIRRTVARGAAMATGQPATSHMTKSRASIRG